ncbi:hypothetical protein OGAPHI_003122 [Ogataea philodendri]|uniref:Secreted protein n=1 Tax=Ogataea philodendri TaxID=1378263 RepID=A0A9P8T5X6_9ASCO|nr:uncharacterized protein OGAPHI_003122 [Ogataea philodendri]KAH3667473.1 hypothetical protein OGAPHI_003122 [Ogataea philodendri]
MVVIPTASHVQLLDLLRFLVLVVHSDPFNSFNNSSHDSYDLRIGISGSRTSLEIIVVAFISGRNDGELGAASAWNRRDRISCSRSCESTPKSSIGMLSLSFWYNWSRSSTSSDVRPGSKIWPSMRSTVLSTMSSLKSVMRPSLYSLRSNISTSSGPTSSLS